MHLPKTNIGTSERSSHDFGPQINGKIGACQHDRPPPGPSLGFPAGQRPCLFEQDAAMTKPTSRHQRYQRIRTLALSAGMVLGMVAATFGPQLAHAARASKKILSEKFVALPDATPEQLQAADRVMVGSYECEFGKRVSVGANTKNKGYFDLTLGKQSWIMKPVLSSTGAIRLEDVKGGTLLIQILTKSMLMDVKAGRRLVDGCANDTQRAAEAELAKQPPRESIFGTPQPVGNQ